MPFDRPDAKTLAASLVFANADSKLFAGAPPLPPSCVQFWSLFHGHWLLFHWQSYRIPFDRQ